MCNNERGWAKVCSRHGRVSLIQQGYHCVERLEIWESERCTFSGPERRFKARFGFLSQATFGIPESLAAFRHCWPVLKKQRTDVIIACANPLVLTALFLRLLGKTRRVVCLVSDYFPPQGPLSVRVYRRISGGLTRWLCRLSDEAWAVSPRIPTVQANPRSFVVPLYIDDGGVPPGTRAEVIYIGMPTPDHGLDLLFEICRRHGLRLNLVGESPYLQSIKHLAPPDTVFHGFITDPETIKRICARCFCGYAVYRNVGPHNYSYYGVPSKTLNYFANNTPVITTDTADLSQQIEKYGIGHVVEPALEPIEAAVLDIKNRFGEFYAAINRFRSHWNAGVEEFHRERLAALLEDK